MESRSSERLGNRAERVAEYFLFDPEADYLMPPLQGFRQREGQLQRLEPNERGAFVSEVLGLTLCLEDLRLMLTDFRTGERLLRPQEEHRARRAAEGQARAAEALQQEEHRARFAAEALQQEEHAARRAAEARARAAEDELARLRAELAKRGT